MIQRLQSVYLLLAIIFSIALFFVPIASVQYLGQAYFIQLIENGNLLTSNFIPLFVLFDIVLLLLIVQLFSYKNRKKQLLIGKVCIVLLIGFYVITASYFVFQQFNVETFKVSYGIFIPVINIFLLILTNRRIKKDEELVRSIDRIR